MWIPRHHVLLHRSLVELRDGGSPLIEEEAFIGGELCYSKALARLTWRAPSGKLHYIAIGTFPPIEFSPRPGQDDPLSGIPIEAEGVARWVSEKLKIPLVSKFSRSL